jgi:hypothetical protein
MKCLIMKSLRLSAGLLLASSVLFGAAAVRAESDDQARPEPQADAQPAPSQVQPPHAQARPLPPSMPNGDQPYMNWRPLEVAIPGETKSESSFAWDPLRFGIAAEIRTLWPQNRATRRLVGKDDPNSGGAVVSGDVLRPTDKVRAVVDLGWNLMTNTNANSWSLDQVKLRTHLVTMGLSLRYFARCWLAPYARVAGGLGWDKVTVEGESGTYQDKHLFTHGSAGAGIYLRSPGLRMATRVPAFSMAVMGSIEGGYFLAPSSDVALKASSDSQIKNPISSPSVPLGTMGRSAPYLRVTFGLAF